MDGCIIGIAAPRQNATSILLNVEEENGTEHSVRVRSQSSNICAVSIGDAIRVVDREHAFWLPRGRTRERRLDLVEALH